MRVVKLGGSLLTSQALPACLHKLSLAAEQTVIVPGGGMFADQVRLIQQDYGFADVYAHQMALLAMQQVGLLIKALQPTFNWFSEVAFSQNWQGTAIWQPDIAELDRAGVPASWAITSDSLAAWFAAKYQADHLVLVKSAPVPDHYSLPALQQLGLIDEAFCHYASQLTCPVTIIHHEQFLSTL